MNAKQEFIIDFRKNIREAAEIMGYAYFDKDGTMHAEKTDRRYPERLFAIDCRGMWNPPDEDIDVLLPMWAPEINKLIALKKQESR